MNPVPSKDLLTRTNLTILAPYYADIRISDPGGMYFRTLDILNNASELQSNEIKQIEEKIRTFENISSFTTQFILFATWYKVNPVQSAFDINKVKNCAK